MDERPYLLCVQLSNRYKNEYKLLSNIFSPLNYTSLYCAIREMCSLHYASTLGNPTKKNYIICSNNVSMYQNYTYPNYC
jgi:hypothetical protein